MVGGSDREVALPIPGTIPEIVRFPSRIPTSLFRIDVVKAVLLALIEAHAVEDKKFGLCPKVRRIRDAAPCEILLRLAGDMPWIAIVALLGDRVHNVTHQHQRRHFRKRVHEIATGIRLQQHVALMDPRPGPYGGTINSKACLERGFGELLDGIGNVVPQSRNVGETEIQYPGFMFLGEIEDTVGVRHWAPLHAGAGCYNRSRVRNRRV